MINATMQDAINVQINLEQSSAQLYLAMSGAMEGKNFHGFARWLRVQAEEEGKHATRLVDHLLGRGGRLELGSIEKPPAEFGSVTQLFEKVLQHEQFISASIDRLFELARAQKDHASEVALQWFVTEQVEEESTASQILAQVRAVGEQGGGIWYLDGKLGKRGS
jgi:ferritin